MPQRLKPSSILGLFGTTEVVPFHGGFKLTHYPVFAGQIRAAVSRKRNAPAALRDRRIPFYADRQTRSLTG